MSDSVSTDAKEVYGSEIFAASSINKSENQIISFTGGSDGAAPVAQTAIGLTKNRLGSAARQAHWLVSRESLGHDVKRAAAQ